MAVCSVLALAAVTLARRLSGRPPAGREPRTGA